MLLNEWMNQWEGEEKLTVHDYTSTGLVWRQAGHCGDAVNRLAVVFNRQLYSVMPPLGDVTQSPQLPRWSIATHVVVVVVVVGELQSLWEAERVGGIAAGKVEGHVGGGVAAVGDTAHGGRLSVDEDGVASRL